MRYSGFALIGIITVGMLRSRVVRYIRDAGTSASAPPKSLRPGDTAISARHSRPPTVTESGMTAVSSELPVGVHIGIIRSLNLPCPAVISGRASHGAVNISDLPRLAICRCGMVLCGAVLCCGMFPPCCVILCCVDVSASDTLGSVLPTSVLSMRALLGSIQ